MKLQDILKCLVPAVISLLITTLEHEKSFLLQDGASIVNTIAFYKDSLLYTSSNDIVQKDIETGLIQRTFRAHTGTIYTFIVTDDFKMISSAWDDMIIVWSLESGSVMKRIWLKPPNTQVMTISYQSDQLYVGGLDKKLRQVDLVTDKVVIMKSYGVDISAVLAVDDNLYVGKTYDSTLLEKIYIPNSSLMLIFEGHISSVVVLYYSKSMLFSGSVDRNIISWNAENGALIRMFQRHSDFVLSLVVNNDELYSTGADRQIFQWDINDGMIKRIFPITHTGAVRCIDLRNGELYSGSQDTTVIKWNISTSLPIRKYTGRQKVLNSVVLWKNFAISGGDDNSIRLWDISFDSLDPYAVLINHTRSVNCLYVYEDTIFSGAFDNTIVHWNLSDLSYLKALMGPSSAVAAFAAGNSFLYAGGIDTIIWKWEIKSGALIAEFIRHSGRIASLQLGEELIFSCAFDNTIKIWDIESTQNIRTLNTVQTVFVIFLYKEFIISGLANGLRMYSVPGVDVLVDLNENSICYCIASSTLRLYSGHVESLIRGRDFDTLNILETFQGHQDIVYSLCVDVNGVLYSASFDGSIKRWDTASRKIAFSFENRNASVVSLAASENFLFVGTKSGVVNLFKIDTAVVVHSAYYHQKAVTSLIAYKDRFYSSGLDGYVLEFSSIEGHDPMIFYSDTQAQIRSIARTITKILLIRDDTEIIILPLNKSSGITKKITSSGPIASIAATEMFVLAGSKSGLILAWSLEDLRPAFEFKGHTAQVNFLLVDQDNLYSASNDKTIIQWSLETFNFIRTLKRFSSSALGHLGPINSLSICRGALFSAGSDITTRRWNTETGRHEGVYFGASKSVTSVTCYNGSVFSGSDDFSVLMYKPIFSEERSVATTTTISVLNPRSRKGAKTVLKENSKVSESSQPIFLTIGIVAGVVIIVLMATIFLSIYGKSKDKTPSSPTTVTNTTYGFSNASDLETVVNSVMGISKHAAFLIESSLIAQEKRIAKGGGGELFIAKVMSPALKKKAGETVIQKVVFIKNKANEEAFYQEVGIMIMLSTYPHFCQIIGYTENPLSMILKYYPDGSLSDWLRKSRISETAAVIVLREIAEALNVMHTHYLAHCDIKPQNVLIEEVDGVPSCFLTDFGITQVLSDKIVASRMFNVINLRGLSVSYASPEAFRNFKTKKYASVDFKKYDIFSFGCVTFDIVEKKTPWA